MPEEHQQARKALQTLLEKLKKLPNGPLDAEQQFEVIGELSKLWDSIPGATDSSMADHKLNRAESWRWNPDAGVVTFKIERHGATVKGSSRAEMQMWVVDLVNCTAQQPIVGHRQLEQPDKRFPSESAVKKIIDLVKAGHESPPPDGAKWKNENTLSIQPSVFLNLSSYSKQTQNDRTRRIRKAANEALIPLGWAIVSGGGYWSIKRKQ